MKVTPDRKLFWFLREGIELDLNRKSTFDMYVQQILSFGRSEDVRALIRRIGVPKLKESFERIKSFLPNEVRKFWEVYFGDT